MIHPLIFSWNWITMPIGLGFIAYIAWETRKQGKEKIIESLRNPSAPTLEIEGIPLDIWDNARYRWCQILIHNTSSTQSAKNVEVKVLAYEDELPLRKGTNYQDLTSPVILKPENAGTVTIAPQDKATFNLFFVVLGPSVWIDGEGKRIEGKSITGRFTKDAYNEEQPKENLVLFRWKKTYRLKLVATAIDLRSQREFNLIFSDEGSYCRFNLTKV